MNTPRDIAGLVERLRTAGFRVDTRQYLTAHQLLLGYARLGRRLEDDAEALVSHLGPVFCTSPEEQARFAEVARAWLGPPPAARRPTRAKLPFAAWHHRRWLLPLAILLLVAAAAGLVAWRHYHLPVPLEGAVAALGPDDSRRPAPEAVVTLAGETVPLDGEGRFRLDLRRIDGPRELAVEMPDHVGQLLGVDADTPQPLELLLLPRPPPPPPPEPAADAPLEFGQPVTIPHPASRVPGESVEVTDWRAAILAGLAAALLSFSLWTLAEWLRRRLVLSRLPTADRPDIKTLAADGAAPRDLDEKDFRRLAADLRRPRALAVQDLDVKATVHATARSGGLFQARWRTRRAIPEYLVLVGRLGGEDHQARLAEDLLDRLLGRGVALDRLYFRDDPRLCRREDGRHATLAELALQHHRAVLFLFAEAASLFNPLSGEPQPWLEGLELWPRRVLFTPLPPAHWTRQEWQLAAAGWVVLPAGEAGLQTYAGIGQDWRMERLFPAPYARPFPALVARQSGRWLDRNPPPAATAEKLLRQLHAYLGDDGFAWLAACAVYPELSWPITLRLWEALPGETGDREGRLRTLLPDLARLPWFRHGGMPDWLRASLIALLTPAQERAVRRSLELLLEQAADRILTAGQPRGLRIGHWIGALDVLRTEPEDSPLQDTVFLGYMARTDIDRLSVLAPRALGRLFRQMALLPDKRSAQAMHTVGGLLARLAARVRGWLLFRPQLSRALASAALGVGVLALLASVLTRAVALPASDLPTGFNALAFAPDGGRLATASGDHLARIWDLASRTETARLEGHAGSVLDVAFSPEGARVVTASADGSAKLWDATDGALLHVLEGHEGPVRSAEYGPGGTRILTASDDGTVRIWDAATGEEIQRLAVPGVVAATSTRFGPGIGGRLLTASTEAGAALWDVDTGREIRQMTGQTGPLTDARFSPDGTRFATASQTGSVWLWDAADGREALRLEVPGGAVRSATFSPDGAWLVTAGEDGVARVWDTATGRLLGTLPGLGTGLREARFAPDGRLLAALGEGEVVLWPVRKRDLPVQVPEKKVPTKQPPAKQPPAKQPPEKKATDQKNLATVPRLLGMPLDRVELTLKKAGLALGQVREQTSASRMTPGTVVRQSPSAGTRMAPGSRVDLTIQAVPAQMAAKAPPGWCCIVANQASQRDQPGGVFPMGEKECLGRGGIHYLEEARAIEECARFAGLTPPALPAIWEKADVAEIQALLAKAGYWKGAMDGRADEALIAALRRFQEDSGLPADGLPGPQTLDRLRNPGKADNMAPRPPQNLRLQAR